MTDQYCVKVENLKEFLKVIKYDKCTSLESPLTENNYNGQSCILVSAQGSMYPLISVLNDSKVISFEEFMEMKRSIVKVEHQVGDIHSDAKGSGARYNSGKPDYSLLVISDLYEMIRRDTKVNEHSDEMVVLAQLGEFQKTGDVSHLLSIFDNIDFCHVEESTFVFTYGKQKYTAWNWSKGMNWSVPLACAVRHILTSVKGIKNDEESGHTHMGHTVCNIFMLLHYVRHYKEGNDLPSPKLFEIVV